MATATPVKSLSIPFEFERETKGAVRYAEVVDGLNEPKIGTLYIRKSALASLGLKSIPDKLTATIAL